MLISPEPYLDHKNKWLKIKLKSLLPWLNTLRTLNWSNIAREIEFMNLAIPKLQFS